MYADGSKNTLTDEQRIEASLLKFGVIYYTADSNLLGSIKLDYNDFNKSNSATIKFSRDQYEDEVFLQKENIALKNLRNTIDEFIKDKSLNIELRYNYDMPTHTLIISMHPKQGAKLKATDYSLSEILERAAQKIGKENETSTKTPDLHRAVSINTPTALDKANIVEPADNKRTPKPHTDDQSRFAGGWSEQHGHSY